MVINTSPTSSSSLYASAMTKGIGGLVSGLDTDKLVEQMTSLTRSKIAKQYQAKQKLIWKQEAYRDAITSFSNLQNKFLNVDSQYALGSQAFFNSSKATSSSDTVKILGSTAGSQVSFSIDSVSNLAKAATMTGGSASRGLELDIANPEDLNGKSLVLELDGVKKTIEFSGFASSDTSEQIQSKLQDLIDSKFKPTGTGHMIDVDLSAGKLSLQAAGSRLTVYGTEENSSLEALGLTEKQSNTLGVGQTLADIKFAGGELNYNEDGKVAFSINGTSFEFDKNSTLTSVMNKINSSSAGVKLSYSQSSDTFMFTSTTTGADSEIVFDNDSSGLLALMGGGGYSQKAGENSIFTINGKEMQRTSNIITIDGVKMELTAKTENAVNISAKQDTDKIIEGIKSFIEEYNGIVDSLYPKLNEKTYKDYPPLTDEQKKDMTESEIKLWDEKAKSGILRSDAIISGILSNMRTALNQRVEEAGLHISQLGISTSSSYKDGGKLQFDEGGEAKLREMVETRPNDVAAFFNSTKKNANGKASGIAANMKDIMTSALKSTGEPKGTLVALAGIKSSTTDENNSLSKQISKIDNVISELKSKLLKEENRYWRQFSNLETTLAQLNSQSNYLQSFFS